MKLSNYLNESKELLNRMIFKSRDMDTIKKSVEHGADVNIKDKEGNTIFDIRPMEYMDDEQKRLLIRNKKMKSKQIKEDTDYVGGYWVSPSMEFYSLEGYGKGEGHQKWIDDNKDKIGLENPTRQSMIQNGWIRIVTDPRSMSVNFDIKDKSYFSDVENIILDRFPNYRKVYIDTNARGIVKSYEVNIDDVRNMALSDAVETT